MIQQTPPLAVFALLSVCALAQGQSRDQGQGPTLLEARRGHQTKILTQEGYTADGPADEVRREPFRLVHYESPVGPLVGYLTHAPKGNRKRPAVIYAHGGFGGIGTWVLKKEIVTAFREAGFVVFCPSWRGENDNPGKFELFYGEVEDSLAAFDYVAALPYVDTSRIYMAGHSTGGTITLLTALAQPKLRAAFSFGGAPNFAVTVQDGGYGNTPYDSEDAQENRLRSALPFAKTLKVPVLYFEGDDSSYTKAAYEMERAVGSSRRRFRAFILDEGDHFNVIKVLGPWVAEELKKDRGQRFSLWPKGDAVTSVFRRGMVELLAKQVDGNPKDEQAWFDLGVIYLAQDRYQPARDAFSKAIALRPGWDLAHFDRGVTLHCLERYPAAIEDYTRWIDQNPEEAVGYAMRGRAYIETGQFFKAERDLGQARRLDPSDAEVRAMHTGIEGIIKVGRVFLVGGVVVAIFLLVLVIWVVRRRRLKQAAPPLLFGDDSPGGERSWPESPI
ncbi:MAG: alpha/beta fold hydrolase [Planctomycetes bacterium]|nr:alpha/beta fold hydrolase [Planctomycetota bacterium]